MTGNNLVILITMILYMAMMIGIGIVYSKKNSSSNDFYLGGRRLGPLVTAMSAEASDMSGWLLMGLPGLALMTGIAKAVWTAIGLAIGTYINWLIVAKRLRVYSHKVDAVTLPEFFTKRFGDKSRFLTVIAALIIVVFFIPYTASGFAACGKLFSSLFGMDYTAAMILSAVVIIVYCTLGGFLAASTTDFIQSIIMTVALFVVVGLGEGLVGGFGNVFENVKNLTGYLDLTRGFDVANNSTGSFNGLAIASTLAWGLGYFGMPHILLRFMAIEDEKKLKTSRRVASVWVVISMSIAILIGVVGFSLVKEGFISAYHSSSEAETIIVDISKFLSRFGYIHAFAAGIILAGILASTMSTADSQLLAAASGISKNIVEEAFGVKLSKKKSMVLARTSVVIISVVAIFLALDPESSVFGIVSFAWAGFGATFGPVVLGSLFWKRANKNGAVAAMITGGVMIFFWKFVVRNVFAGTIFDIYELLPAFILASVALIVVSLLTKAPEKEIVDKFDEVKAYCNAKTSADKVAGC